MSRNFRFTLLLLFLAGLIFSSLNYDVPDFFNYSNNTSNQNISLYIKNSQSYNFDGKGELNSFMSSPSIVQYNESKMLQAQSPQLEIKNKNAIWHISADTVLFDEKGYQFELSQNILIEQPEQTSITTDKLVIDNKKKIAHTDSVVTIKSLQSKTTANGLHANFNEQQVTLKKVKTVYVPAQKP